ncbi:ABC transporter permease [Geomonas paludis]|uniref:ABC transporter permease n=1 Tax=Geomonas paludis TaxID=2740185 RepID=A0A6V8MUG2_9BACT|nr:methionine ABC transporter permease [Geomonas paludis]UPU37722.1 ABC transporter permease [Geomonas paludis]GFO63740.1 metal ABC transporter permease [Geomonas paludis]
MHEDLLPMLLTGFGETLYMVVLSTVAAIVLGLPLGVLVVITSAGHVLESPRLNRVLGAVINVTRSFPFIIMIVLLLPLSRFLVGTTLGATAASVPLSIAAAPFLARIIENSLKEVDRGKVEAALAMGATPLQIVSKVLIPEALASLVLGLTLAVITITGFTATAGAIGAGGLGSLAIRYGYMRYREDVMFATVLILVIFVQGVQWSGDRLARWINRNQHRLG